MNESESGSTNKQIRTALRKIVKTGDVDLIDVIYATVKSVDLTTRTCTVVPITGQSDTEMEDVGLQADPSDGMVMEPKVDSTVVVGISTNLSAYVLLYSDIETISWKSGNFGGLTKVIDLTNKLNNLENKVNTLVSTFNAHIHPGVTVGAGVTGPSATPVVGALTPTQRSDIENTKIKHGDK